MEQQRLLLRAAIDEIASMVEEVEDMSGPGLGTWDLGGLIGHFLRAVRTPLDCVELPAVENEALADASAYYAAYLSMRAGDHAATTCCSS